MNRKISEGSQNKAPFILIVEDDKIASARIATALSMNGFLVEETHTISDAKRCIEIKKPDHMILDISLPDGSGLELIDASRQQNIGIVCVSANDAIQDRLTALRLGADDYIAKPVTSEELILKLKNLHRRIQDNTPESSTFRELLFFEEWKCDPIAQRVFGADQQQLTLTPGEYAILLVFLTHSKSCLSRDQIMTLAANEDHIANDRSVDIMVHRLRKKMERDAKNPKFFVTVYGVGYIFPVDVMRKNEDIRTTSS